MWALLFAGVVSKGGRGGGGEREMYITELIILYYS